MLAALSPARAGWVRLPAERPWHTALGALAAGLGLSAAPAELVMACAAALAAVLAALRAPGLGILAAALLAAGSLGGHLRLASLDAAAGLVRDGERVALRAELLTPPRPGRFGSSAEARVTTGRLRGARLLLRAPTWSPLPAALGPGRELALSGRLAALPPDGPGYAAYLRRRGVAGELALERARPTGRRRGGLPGALDRMRTRAERAVSAGMPPRQAALLRGMVLGEDEAIDPVTRDDFRASGLAHLLAVSGQNVMLLAALALPALMLWGSGPYARMGVVGGLIAVYVPLAGAGPSLQRAGLMGLAGLAAMVASRPASRSYALLLAAAGTLAWNPRAGGDAGWQLSFAAVAGILVLGVPLGGLLGRAGAELITGPRGSPPRERTLRAVRLLADGVAVTVAATLATAPLLAHHFGYVPLAGLPANLLALPAVAPAMWLGMVKTAIGQVGPPAAADALGPPATVAVRYLGWLAERFADLPRGRLALRLESGPAVAAAYAGMGLSLWAIRRAAGRLAADAGGGLHELAGRWRRLPRWRRHALLAALALTVAGATAAGLTRPGPPERLTVRFLDVGQGDATLIQHPDGTAVLFDGGPPEAGVARLLRRAGVRRLALVVATHSSRDHHGGLAEVLHRFRVGLLLDGGDGTGDPAFRELEREAAERHVRRVRALAPLTLTLAGGDLVIRILAPAPRPPGPAPEDPNPRGVVAVISSGGFDLMLSADAESESLLPLALPGVDAMKVPHHGSSDPGLPEVLERLRPEVAAIEVGRHNTYGHPAPSTLAALHRAGAAVYRTDRDGTVSLTVDGPDVLVDTEH